MTSIQFWQKHTVMVSSGKAKGILMFFNKMKEEMKKVVKINDDNQDNEEEIEVGMDEKKTESDDPADKYLVEMKQNFQAGASDENSLMKAVKIEDIENDESSTEPEETGKNKTGLGNLNDLFEVEEEEEKTNLDMMVASLPEISCQEILEQVNKVKNMINKKRISLKEGGES